MLKEDVILKKWILIVGIVLIGLTYQWMNYLYTPPEAFQLPPPKQHNIQALELRESIVDKKVIMILVDSMMGPLVNSSIEKGTMPALQFLIDNGQYYEELISPFPTMSVTIEATLLTGEMPHKHQLPGLCWYDATEDRIVNYGTSISFLLKSGLSQGAVDTLYRLNNEHLSDDVETIFETLDKHDITSGAINTLIYRGPFEHNVEIPEYIHRLTGVPKTFATTGPHILSFGQFINPTIVKQYDFPDSPVERFGLKDEYSMNVIQALIEHNQQPDFLIAFYPDFDKIAHHHSPHYRKGFEEIDQYLQGILDMYDSWEEALEENIFIILGDHGQDKILPRSGNPAIDLPNLYAKYDYATLNEPTSNSDIAFAVNQRMAYVYDVNDAHLLEDLAKEAIKDERIAFAAWGEGDWVRVIDANNEGSLRYKSKGQWKDKYDQTWSITGNMNILTLEKNREANEVAYVDYPDVLNQLESAIKSSREAPTLVLTAKPGYSFRAEGIPVHADGGDHGGIHKNDVLAALVIAGTDKKPQSLRMVDLKQYILELFDVNDVQQ